VSKPESAEEFEACFEHVEPTFLVRVKKGVSPYGGRLFMARWARFSWGTVGYSANSTWRVDVKSNSRTVYEANHEWTRTFGGYSDWRVYQDHEIEIVRRMPQPAQEEE
tara:strand:- start:822 stop:1145 length:324 start_codon:yes stop_codon:yes gene_type:complete